MLTGALVAGSAIFYFTEQYERALLLIVLSIVSGGGALLWSLINPGWYQQKRLEAGLDIDFFNPRHGMSGLLIVKAVVVGALLLAAWHIAGLAGYL